jgi:uncharacterized repeat protein (TIGR01451 family)
MSVKLKHLLYIGAGGAALLLGTLQPAFASPTAAGTTVSNIATVNFQVGGVSQPSVGSSPTGNSSGSGTGTNFLVDREIGVTITPSTTVTTVAPGATGQATAFTVTNTGNDTQDFLFEGQVGATGQTHTNPTGSEQFVVTGVQVFVSKTNVATYNPSTDTGVWLDELPAGSSWTVFVVSSVPLTATNGQTSLVTLVAQAAQGGAAGTQGAAITNDDNGHISPAGKYSNGATTVAAGTASNIADSPTVVNNVFIDAAGDFSSVSGGNGSPDSAADTASNGQFGATNVYQVGSAVLTVTKTATVLSDPINGTSNPKAIPGAVVQYTITVVNSGSQSATSVVITDPIPTNTTYKAGTIVQTLNGVATPQTDAKDGDNSDYNVTTAGAITSTFPSLGTSGTSATGIVTFDITIN